MAPQRTLGSCVFLFTNSLTFCGPTKNTRFMCFGIFHTFIYIWFFTRFLLVLYGSFLSFSNCLFTCKIQTDNMRMRTATFHWPSYGVCYYVLSMFMLSFIFVIVCGLFKWNLCRFSIIYLYNCHWRSNYQEGRIWISLTGFTLPHFCARPKKGLPTNIISFSHSMSQGDLLILLTITV